ncbi:MAG: ShlB/FhaC/HecB family hemolysin secretion/activation protein [Pseudomonadota bacterium]
MTDRTTIGALLGLAVVLGAPAAAQDAQQSLQDLREGIEEEREGLAQPAPVTVPRASITAPAGAEDIELILAGIALVDREGQPLVDDGRLPLAEARAGYAGRLGQQMTLAEVYEIARGIEVTLKREGYVFTRVVLPRQDIEAEGATVRIAVLTSTVESVAIEEPAGPVGGVRALIEQLVSPLNGLENPRIQDLERASLLVTDLPGLVRATFVPVAGSAPGLIQLTLNVEREAFNAVGVLASNDSPVQGPGVIGGIGFANTWGPFGASTEVSYFNSWSTSDFPDLDERNAVGLTQRFFFGTGTSVAAAFTYSRTNPGDVLRPLGLEGDQYEGRLTVEHPLLRSRMHSLWFGGGFEATQSDVDIDAQVATLTDDATRAVFLGARGAHADPYGGTAWDLSLTYGFEGLGASGAGVGVSDGGDPNLSNPFYDGDFFVLRGEVRRDQPIRGNVSARLRMQGQYAPDALLSTQTISLGGTRYLKGYEPSEVSGDSGFAVYGELRYDDSVSAFGRDLGWGVYGFADYGVVFQSDTPGSEAEDRTSAGFGARLRVPNGPVLELELAQPLDEAAIRTGERDPRINGSLVWFF